MAAYIDPQSQDVDAPYEYDFVSLGKFSHYAGARGDESGVYVTPLWMEHKDVTGTVTYAYGDADGIYGTGALTNAKADFVYPFACSEEWSLLLDDNSKMFGVGNASRGRIGVDEGGFVADEKGWLASKEWLAH
jgi:hypothetical protein